MNELGCHGNCLLFWEEKGIKGERKKGGKGRKGSKEGVHFDKNHDKVKHR